MENLFADAERLFRRVSATNAHQAFTSALTYYEVEEALYKQLSSSAKGLANALVFLVPQARAIVQQLDVLVRLYNINVVDLTAFTVRAQLENRELDRRGVRAADSLHVTTAASLDADFLVSADEAILKLDGVVYTKSGQQMRCVDSDEAAKAIDD